MDCATGPKQLPTAADHPLLFHETHHERFFMLCVDLKVNGEQANLSGVDSRSLILRASHQPSWKISSESFLSAADEAGKKYGIDHVAKLRCGHLPILEVEFASRKTIMEFLKSLRKRKFQNFLETQLRRKMKSKTSTVNLDASLHLVVPLPDCDASVTEVTLNNLDSSLQTLKQGNQFSYKKVMTRGPDASYRKGIQV